MLTGKSGLALTSRPDSIGKKLCLLDGGSCSRDKASLGLRFCLHAPKSEEVNDLARSTVRLWSSTSRNSHRTCVERSSLRSAALMPVSAGGGDERLVSVDPYYSGGAAPSELQG